MVSYSLPAILGWRVPPLYTENSAGSPGAGLSDVTVSMRGVLYMYRAAAEEGEGALTDAPLLLRDTLRFKYQFQNFGAV
ncbi:hypothetical protein KGM_208191 [Danaus plexippus plexippus]|uniref:Uncharacterized protein n=1 Tax=Danaus plexippus plexippus TaxID=278856 RepID=A0A212FE98_DANPL|nr:hypothetical protein KGM_208191 [Danaus plexippus plexippus]